MNEDIYQVGPQEGDFDGHECGYYLCEEIATEEYRAKEYCTYHADKLADADISYALGK